MSRGLNKKAQSGETVTWIVATLIIIVILLIAIYASFALAKAQKIITTGKNPSALNSKYSGTSDLIAAKCLTGFLSTNENGIVYSKLNQGFDDSNGNLAVKIVEPLKNDYSNVWLGIDNQKNNFFGNQPGTLAKGNIEINIKLNNGKNLEMLLVK